MHRTAAVAASILGAIVFTTPAAWAECSQHTFDPCPKPASAYNLEVDSKTGRTWLKPAPPAPTHASSRLALLSAVARNVPAGSLARGAAERDGRWRTRVEAEGGPPPRSK